jgi:hypothetical protein
MKNSKKTMFVDFLNAFRPGFYDRYEVKKEIQKRNEYRIP